MASARHAPPAGLTDAAELPATAFPDVPGWTENYWFVTYDPDHEVGVWSHMTRAAYDHRLWREISIVYLAGGERLISKAYGRGETGRGPGGPALAFTCAEPWNRWTTRYDGAARRTTDAALASGLSVDGIHEPVAYELDWEGISPAWAMGEAMADQTWGDVHYQQAMRVTGTLRQGGEEIAFDGRGVRDHTRGPRDYADVEHHVAAHGVFPSGRAFIVLDIHVVGGALTKAAVFEDGVLREVELRNSPMLTSSSVPAREYVLALGDATISAEILHNSTLGFAGANEVVIGYDPAGATHVLYEGMTRFTWGAETGYGLTERSVRGAAPVGSAPR